MTPRTVPPWFFRQFLLAGAALSVLSGLTAQKQETGEAANVPNASFENGEGGPLDWSVEGDVVLDESSASAGKKSLRLTRDPTGLPPTRASSRPFPLIPGVWELAGAYAADLYSPDASFNVSISVSSLDRSGTLIKARRLVAVSGASPWKHFKERVEIPVGTTSASIELAFNKTHGTFRADGFSLTYVGASIPMEGGDRKVVFRTNRVGNLFYPGDPVNFEVTVETPVLLPADRLSVEWDVTDFYQAAAVAPATAALVPAGTASNGWHRYVATLDLARLPLKVGPYYEVHTSLDLGAPRAAMDVASFAVLPEPVTRHLDPLATPFGAHTWNATVYDYFPLAARLGIRRCLVFWSWPERAPYMPEFDQGHAHQSRIAWPKRFGLAPYGVLYPLMWIEHQDGPQHSDEALRAGIRQSIEKYRKDGLWGFQIGNEPPSWNPEWVKRDVAAYKVAYEAIKEVDTSIVVIGSAIGPNETFFEAGFQPWQDVYNIHAYADLGELRHQMRKYRELFKKYGGAKPIWSTEIGSKSQGLPRDVIARDIIRKAICFFADGGGFFSWFAVGGMPDPEGERTGSYSDSMDLFAAKYGMHLPRLDAVAYYHLINTLATKAFIAEASYPGGIHGFLFRDEFANALFVFWSDGGPRDVRLPLPGTHEVGLTWMDGTSRRLDAKGDGINVRIGDDPVFITFRGDGVALPSELAAPKSIRLEEIPSVLVQGGVAEIKVRQIGDEPLQLSGPPLWSIDPVAQAVDASGARLVTYHVAVPEHTRAQLATFTLSDQTATSSGDSELRFAVPVKGSIEVDLLPVAGAREGEGAIRLRLKNHSERAEPVSWQIEILDTLWMDGGTFKLAEARPASAFFEGAAEDRRILAPGEVAEIVLRMRGLDRLMLYRLRATATDAGGISVQRERRVGGFARVAHARIKPKLDGRLDEPMWRDATSYNLNEPRQFWMADKAAKPWEGLQDLSGAVRFAWDDEHLYIAAEVVDDIFANPGLDGGMWRQDGLQFLIDPFRDAVQSLGRYDYSLGLGQKGLQAWCHMSADASAPAGLASAIEFAVEPTSSARGDRNYEVAIPWSRLAPFKPHAGANLGFTMVINEDDGSGRKSTMGWFGGVHLKETNFVGDLILAE